MGEQALSGAETQTTRWLRVVREEIGIHVSVKEHVGRAIVAYLLLRSVCLDYAATPGQSLNDAASSAAVQQSIRATPAAPEMAW